MTLAHIAAFSIGALVYVTVVPARWRGWTVLLLSVFAVFWLQPLSTVRNLDFMLPVGALGLTVAAWWLTRPPDTAVSRDDRITLGVVIAVVLGLALLRDVRPEFRPTPSRPPDPLVVALGLALVGAVALAVWKALRLARWRGLLASGIALIVVIFVLLKTEPLTIATSAWFRLQAGQDTALAAAADFQWLGFSYIAFRLIHTLRDRQTGRLPALSLREFASYTVFFPALTAGPIDRAERFVKDYRALPEHTAQVAPRFVVGGGRIVVGLVKKFVIADSLALLSLNAANALEANSTLGLWLLLYGFAFRLYFDFSGYTDIAIGIGILYGVDLPENFDRPYARQNLTAFWQSWHITLSQWVRFYVFSPLSRALLQRKPKPSPLLVVVAAQLVTMLVIGLWHGVTWNFALWGLWHGVGLFAHKLWSDSTRAWYQALQQHPLRRRAWTVIGVLLTFHFVALGWVWFALPDWETARLTFARLFGAGW